MDVDVTEPIPAIEPSAPTRSMRPAMIVGGAALAVLLAAVAALVWTFSEESKDAATPKAIATAPSKAPAAAKPAAPADPAAPEAPADAAGGIPGDLDPSALLGGLATDSGLTSSPAFSSPGAPTYGSGLGAPTGQVPNVEWPTLGWEDVAPAVAMGLDSGEIANLVVDIGDWVYGAGLATAANSIDLFQASTGLVGDLLLYDAYVRAGSAGGTSLESLVNTATSAGMSPSTVLTEAVESVSNAALVNPLADTASTLNKLSEAAASMPSVQLPDATALGNLPKLPEMPSLGSLPELPSPGMPSLGALPEMPSLGGMPEMPDLGGLPELAALGSLPKLPGLPEAPEVRLPSLPTPGQVGLGVALTPGLPTLNLPQPPSLEYLQKLPGPKLPKVGLPRFGLPKFGLPKFGPPRLGVPSITKLMGLPF